MSGEKLVFKLNQPHGPSDVFISWQRGSGIYLATIGADNSVGIYNRHGKLVESLRLQGICTGFGWDFDGDILAVITSNSPLLTLWDSNTLKKTQVDTGLRDAMSCVIWAKKGPMLAVGTARGNLTLYNHITAKRVPILGKHNKKITCGAWSAEGLLALGSEDRTLSVSNSEGDTLRMVSLRSEPSEVHFSEMKLDERLGSENTVSMVIGKKTLFLYNLHDPDNPVELAFQQRYGHIVTYKWFGDGYILLGFSAGYFVAISTHIKEVGQELFQVKNHRDNLTDIALSSKLKKVASCGDNM